MSLTSSSHFLAHVTCLYVPSTCTYSSAARVSKDSHTTFDPKFVNSKLVNVGFPRRAPVTPVVGILFTAFAESTNKNVLSFPFYEKLPLFDVPTNLSFYSLYEVSISFVWLCLNVFLGRYKQAMVPCSTVFFIDQTNFNSSPRRCFFFFIDLSLGYESAMCFGCLETRNTRF